jgi:hypothetical protein
MGLLFIVSACATPIGVVRGTTQETYYNLTANVLSSGKPSTWSTQVLQRSDFSERYDDDSAAALLEMRKTFESRVTPDRLFALSELSSNYAEQSGKKNTIWLWRFTPTPFSFLKTVRRSLTR